MIRSTKPKAFEAYCNDCQEVQEMVPEAFDYAGTHCTHGEGGVHYTGFYECSECGGDDFEECE